MSDPNLAVQRQILDLHDTLESLRKAGVPPLYLPYAPRALNPSAGSATLGEFPQPWSALILAFYVTVFVGAPNDGTNFWAITLTDAAGTTLASVNTSAISANVWTRLVDVTITQPPTTNPILIVTANLTLAPGVIYVVPSVALLRTGN